MPAAKQTTKRSSAQAVAEKAPKKPRQDPLFVGTLDAIRQAEDLPENCRDMLLAAAAGCLNTPKDERHEVQNRAVQWIEEAIGSVLAKFQEAAKNADAALTEADAKKSNLEAKVAEDAATLEARREASKAKVAELAEASKVIISDEAAVASATAEQSSGDASFAAAKKEKETLEAALEESAKPLKAGACGAEEAKKHVARLLPLALKVGLDESLTTALPMSGAKALAERGTFDVMVMDGLENGLGAKVVELAKIVEEGAPAAAQRASVVESAQATLAASQERRRILSEELRSAQVSEEEAAAVVEAAKAAVVALEPERMVFQKLCEERRLALENFENYNLGCFQMLKEKESEQAAAAKKEASFAPEAEINSATAGA